MLVPNGPKSRIEYVIKTYRDSKKNRRIILDTIEISLNLMGRDAVAGRFATVFDPLWQYLSFTKTEPVQYTKDDLVRWYDSFTGADSPDKVRDHEQIVSESMDRLSRWAEIRMGPQVYGERHPLDFMIPWIARELGRLSKAEHRGEATGRDMEEARDALMKKAPAIGMWAKQENVDLNRTSLAEALEAVEDFEVEVDVDETTQGTVVYDFGDGWTIQALQTQPQLDLEGEAMQHCVAGYCEEVGQGRAYIYSLRDPRGRPHVTIEWRPHYKAQAWRDEIERLYQQGLRHDEVYNVVLQDPVKFINSGFTQYGSFAQIRGKQNAMPTPKYRERVQQFIRDKFDGDPIGMLMVALPGQRIDFTGKKIRDVDFTEGWGAWEGVNLSQGIFTNAEFEDVQFGTLHEVVFTGALFVNCGFEGDIRYCVFDSAEFHDTRFISPTLNDCSFTEALLHGCNLFPDSVNRCNLRESAWDACTWEETGFFSCSLVDAKFTHGLINKVEFRGSSMAGFKIDDRTEVKRVILEDLDLRHVDLHTVRLLAQAQRNPKRHEEIRWPQGFVEEELA